jgi:hypothetical protein
MNSLTELEMQMIEGAARALGHAPFRYTVRDDTRVHIRTTGPFPSRHWDPLDPTRHDFFDILDFLARHDSLEIRAEVQESGPSGVYAAVYRAKWGGVPVAAVASSENYSIPKAFCLALTRAAQKFHNEVKHDDSIQHESAD